MSATFYDYAALNQKEANDVRLSLRRIARQHSSVHLAGTRFNA
jgi:hypothetical protein